jgi:hypothetical protein
MIDRDELAVDAEKFYYFVAGFSAVSSLNTSTDFRALQYLDTRPISPTNTARLAQAFNLDFDYAPIPMAEIEQLTQNMARVPLLLEVTLQAIVDLTGGDVAYAAQLLSEFYDAQDGVDWRAIIYGAIDVLSLAATALSFITPIPGDEALASAALSARIQRLLGGPGGQFGLKNFVQFLSASKHTNTFVTSDREILDLIQFGINVFGVKFVADFIKGGSVIRLPGVSDTTANIIASDIGALLTVELFTNSAEYGFNVSTDNNLSVSNISSKLTASSNLVAEVRRIFAQNNASITEAQARELLNQYGISISNATVDDVIRANNDQILTQPIIPTSDRAPTLNPIDSNGDGEISTSEWDTAWWKQNVRATDSGPGFSSRIGNWEQALSFKNKLDNIHDLTRPGFISDLERRVDLISAYEQQRLTSPNSAHYQNLINKELRAINALLGL